jgi:hypothetical protein
VKRFAPFPLAARLAVPAILALSSAGCGVNLFSPMTSASGDAQLASAAQAAMDRGDFEAASNYYGQLGDSNADLRASGQAYAILAKHGVGMKAIAASVGTGKDFSTGKVLTSLANSIGTGAGSATRLDIFHAYLQTANIKSATLQGFVRFLTAMGLVAEVLAEGASNPAHMTTSDIALTPGGCTDNPACQTTQASACAKPSGSALTSGTGTFTLSYETNASKGTTVTTDAQMQDASVVPTLTFIKAGINEMTNGLSALGKGGNIGNAFAAFNDALLVSVAFSGDAPCFRELLLSQGIGTY